MIWGYLYIALMLTVTFYVLCWGDREARFAISILFMASALTVAGLWISGTRFEVASLLVAGLDFLVFVIFLGHALLSHRYWTLCLPALQLMACFAHVAKLFGPDILPRVYSAGQGHWAYLQMLLIFLAAKWHRNHGPLEEMETEAR